MRRTQPERMQRKLRAVKTELKRRRHLPIPEQGKWLRSVVNGHFAYYAVPTVRMIPGHKHLVFEEGLQSCGLAILDRRVIGHCLYR